MAIEDFWELAEERRQPLNPGYEAHYIEVETPQGFKDIDSLLIRPSKEFREMQDLGNYLKQNTEPLIEKSIREKIKTSTEPAIDLHSTIEDATADFWSKIQTAVKTQTNAPKGLFNVLPKSTELSKNEQKIVKFIIDVRKNLSSISPLYKEFIEKGGSARALNILYTANLLPKNEPFLPHILTSLNAIGAVERAEAVKLLIKDEILNSIWNTGKATTKILSIASGATISVYSAIKAIVEEEKIIDQTFQVSVVDFDPEAIELSVTEALKRGINPRNIKFETISSSPEESFKLAKYLGLTDTFKNKESKETILASLKIQFEINAEKDSKEEKEKFAQCLGDLFKKKLGIDNYAKLYVVNNTYQNVTLNLHYENMFSYLRKSATNRVYQDIVEAVGIHDYFNDKTSKTFLKSLVSKIIMPGGSAIVGNIVPNAEQYFLYALNWPHMFHRSERDMIDVAKNAEFDSFELYTIPSNIYHLLKLSKKL